MTSTGGIVPCFAECDWPTEFPFCCKFQSYIVCGDNIRHRIFVIAGSGLPNCFEGDPLFHSQQSFGNSLNSIQIDWYIHDELSIWAIYAQHVPFLSNRESQKTYLGLASWQSFYALKYTKPFDAHRRVRVYMFVAFERSDIMRYNSKLQTCITKAIEAIAELEWSNLWQWAIEKSEYFSTTSALWIIPFAFVGICLNSCKCTWFFADQDSHNPQDVQDLCHDSSRVHTSSITEIFRFLAFPSLTHSVERYHQDQHKHHFVHCWVLVHFS